MMETIGIDLGTTNTVASSAGKVITLGCEQDSAVLPSVVAFPPNGQTLVGTAARRRRAIDGKNTIWSSKRLIGRRWRSPEVRGMRERYPFELVQGEDGGVAYRTRVGTLTPVEVAATILRRLFEEAGLDPDRTRAAVAVPSAFQSEHRQATSEAAQQAGLKNLDVVDEPVATALAYLAGGEEKLGRVGVYDLGGGTFELAIVDCQTRPYRVLANKGDLYLGGDDIDQSIASWAADQVLMTHRWDLRDNALVFDRLVLECERAKCRLCYATQTTIELSQVDPAVPGGESSLGITQERLAGLAEDLVKRTFLLCDEVLALAGIKAADLDAVFLAGGTTQLPMVRHAVAKYFDRRPRTEFDPMEVVAIGASITAPIG
jgi:molecular chaperone DnaK